MLTERENLKLVFDHSKTPEWIPYMFNCYNFIIPTEVIADRPPFGVMEGDDWFGCHWIFDEKIFGFAQDPKVPVPCTDITKWKEQVKFPDLDAIDWEGLCAPIVASYDPDRMTQLMLQCGIFERVHALCGFEDTLIAMYEEPEAFYELMEAVTDFRIEVIRRAVKYLKPDLVTNMDDYGTQSGPIMSPEMFREHILPHAIRLGKAINEMGVIYQHHTCGKFDVLMPDMIKMGMQSITAVSPANDVDMLIREYGDRLVFDGCMNNQQILDYPGCTEEMARAEARRAMDKFGPGGNYVAGGYCVKPMEEAVAREVMSYGKTFYKK